MSASAILSIIASQYDTIDNRNEYLGFAELQVNESWFRDKYDLAVAYMAAHLIFVNTDPKTVGSGVGVVIGKKEGELSISYAPPSGTNKSDEELKKSSYGQQFLRIRNNCGFILGVTGGNLKY